MIDIGLTNALAQIRDALYEITDTLKELKETEDTINVKTAHIKHIMSRVMFKVRNARKV